VGHLACLEAPSFLCNQLGNACAACIVSNDIMQAVAVLHCVTTCAHNKADPGTNLDESAECLHPAGSLSKLQQQCG
jgi:hypothetical protein